MQKNWSANQTKFIEWLATPKNERAIENAGDFADHLGVNPATLSRWKSLEGFRESVNDLAREGIGNRLPEVYGALLREAEAGSFQHIKLTLELSGDYVEQHKIDHSGTLAITKGYRTVSPDDWDADKNTDNG